MDTSGTQTSFDPARTVVVASNNAHKLVEIASILGASPTLAGYSFVSLKEIGDFEEPEETGETFRENALIKARAALDATGLSMAVADDSGLMVDALGGAPGVYSARYAGEPTNDTANNAKLIDALKDVGVNDRSARFHSSVVLVRRDAGSETILYGDGDCEGTIAFDLRGTNGFGYDPLFELADKPGLRMAELTFDQKNEISHRRRALDDLVSKLG